MPAKTGTPHDIFGRDNKCNLFSFIFSLDLNRLELAFTQNLTAWSLTWHVFHFFTLFFTSLQPTLISSTQTLLRIRSYTCPRYTTASEFTLSIKHLLITSSYTCNNHDFNHITNDFLLLHFASLLTAFSRVNSKHSPNTESRRYARLAATFTADHR